MSILYKTAMSVFIYMLCVHPCWSNAAHEVTVVVTEMADFQITSTTGSDVHIALLKLNEDALYSEGTFSVTHTSVHEKKIYAQVTSGPTAQGIILKAQLQAPVAGDAESKSWVNLLNGDSLPLDAQSMVEKIPAGSFTNLALNYIAQANISAAVGNNVFTVTFTISE